MNKTALAGGMIAVLMVSAVALAASPSPSPYASPAPSGSPSASGSPAASPKASAAAAQSWTAQVAPVQITGSATLQKQADGTGLLTLQLSGMINEQAWTVDVDAGTLARPAEQVNIAHKAGEDVQKTAPDQIQVHLTGAEMKLFAQALASRGVVIFISDGTRLAAAEFAAQ